MHYLKAASITDTGKVRKNNQDAILVDEEEGIFLLADGMGGHNAGEVASDLAVKVAYAFIREEITRTAVKHDALNILKEALFRAHRAIQEKADSDSGLHGMGTTLVEVYIRNNLAHVCHAGDSRAYLFRNTLQMITKDHTVGDSYVARGYMEREKIPPRLWHILTQALGTRDCPVPDGKVLELKLGDIVLLCSDGLTDMLDDDDIQRIIRGHAGRLDEMVDALATEANIKGGKDNISVIAVER